VVPGVGRRILPRADIVIERGRITAVGRGAGGDGGDVVLEGRDRIAIPGLVNAHSHTYETFNRGAIPGRPMEIWALYGHPVLGVGRRTPEEVYWRTLVPCLEMLRNGVTGVVDDISMSFDFRDELVEAVMQAYRDSGLRAWVSVKVMDRPLYRTLTVDAARIPRDLMRAFRRIRIPDVVKLIAWSRRNMRREERLGGLARFIPNPSAPQSCTDQLLRATHRLATESGFPWVIHVQETRLQAVQGPRQYGRSMVGHLARLGLLTRVTAIMHGIWVDAEDIRRIADGGATVVHNPASNLRLGSGLAPVRSLLDAGVHVGLGSDGTSSNDGQSLFEAMKLAAIIHSLTDPDHRRWITPAEAFRMATEGGAWSALWESQVGAIEPGKRADIVLLDRLAPAFAPRREPVAQLVYAESGHAVRAVVVDGRIVVDEDRVLTADLPGAVRRLAEIGERLQAEHRRTTVIARRLEPIWRAMLEEHRLAPLPFERLAWPASPPAEAGGRSVLRPRRPLS
jgi:5-methylthioadenosine/S-adenosylhomocysteine deaminase